MSPASAFVRSTRSFNLAQGFPGSVLWSLAALTTLWHAAPATAQGTYTWTGASGGGLWTNASNWLTAGGTAASPPANSGQHYVLAGSTQLTGTTANRILNSMTFAANAGAFVISSASVSGNTLTLSGPLTNQSANVQTFNTLVPVDGKQQVNTGASGGAVVFNRNVSGADARLDIEGSGRVVFNAINQIPLVRVSASATVTGTGRLLSAVVQPGGSITPGGVGSNSYGTLTLGSGTTNAALTVESAGTIGMGISGTSLGTSYDSIVINGTGSQYGGVLSISFDTSTSYAVGTVFDLFQLPTATPSGNFEQVLVQGGAYSGLTFSGPVNGEWTSTLTTDGQQLVFSQVTGNLVVVPEPASIMVALTGVALVGLHRWRRAGRSGTRGHGSDHVNSLA